MRIIYLLSPILILVAFWACSKESNCEFFNYALLEARANDVEVAQNEFLVDPTSSNCQLFIAAQNMFDEEVNNYINISSDCENIPVDSIINLQIKIHSNYIDHALVSLDNLYESAVQQYLIYVQVMTEEKCINAKLAYQKLLSRAVLYNECYPTDQITDLIESLTLTIDAFPC